MPGVLRRDEDDRNRPRYDDRADLVQIGSTSWNGKKESTVEEQANGALYANGMDHTRNGTFLNGVPATAAPSTGDPLSVLNSLSGQLPPEIEHITVGYQPLSKLITRLVQETFNGLTDVINELSEMQSTQLNNHAGGSHLNNHINGNGHSSTSQGSASKKLRLLDFAQDRRAQFIKTLVLSQWSRQAEAVGKVIDLKVWLDGQTRILDDATLWMGELKRILSSSKMPSPDLKTALEVLSTGKASWLPDLGYIPPEPLSSRQLLKALRNINTLLSIRLNLHENIPHAFRSFSISSGRATFHVPEEFEVDLSIAEEDPTSQLYFIDFRFLFTPSLLEIPAGRLRDELEGKANDVLKRDGLHGCYSFMHDLVLTHKISILKRQAGDMARRHWSENIRVDAVHRSLVIQYWVNRPGGKSWVEIGIKKGRRRTDPSWSDNQGTPYIALRWMRYGKEVLDQTVKLALDTLSMDALLKQVIAAHTNHVLRNIKDKLREGKLYSNKALSLSHELSTSEPAACSLTLQLTRSKTITVALEPISGNFAISPASPANPDLNNLLHPATEASSRIATLRCVVAQEEVESCAKCIAWESLKTIKPSIETMKASFPRDTMRIGFFRVPPWGMNWLLAFTTSMNGDFWWIVELPVASATSEAVLSNAGLQRAFRSVHEVPLYDATSYVKKPSFELLSQVERAAAGMISRLVDTRQLIQLDVPYLLQSFGTDTSLRVPSLYIRFTCKDVPPSSRTSERQTLALANETVKLSYHGLDPACSEAVHVAEARLINKIPNIAALTSSIDSDLAFHPASGAFAFRLHTPVGTSSIPFFLERMKRIEQLLRFLGILKRCELQCETVSLSRLVFIYATEPKPLKAAISYAIGAPMKIGLESGNPHVRICDFLTTLLNGEGGLEFVTTILRLTSPLLRAMAAIESTQEADNVAILPRSTQWYQIRFKNPHARFDIKLRPRRDTLMWYVQEMPNKEGPRDEVFAEQIKALFNGHGDGWEGKRTGIAATIDGVEGLLKRIDELVRGAKATEAPDEKGTTNGEGQEGRDVVVLD
ncbi:Mediator complex, subunit Med14 [Lasallia pustulata]|uniref:Mediator of RNA polymerase II transcription subunit 14 n=1 Tax=Lasallia pustulata TaxID=136370 RepID=A0A1W5CZC9_9LECA|nr:Mediator complex, subunit Med14 [Lasallia pustulata]